MKILTTWLRTYLPELPATDRQLADDLTLRGIAVEGVHDLGVSVDGKHNGHLFEMDITTNRVDAMNHYGIAREAATIYNLPLSPLIKDSSFRPDPELVEGAAEKPASLPQKSTEPAFPVRIEAGAKPFCGRFTAQVLRNVTIAPSEGKIAEYFNLLGQKQISNAVDASNYVLLGMGHPTHAFDLDKLEGGIVVRLAKQGEKLKLLDGTDRTLEADDLVVADEKKALALAGVMGGWDSMITPETKNILVEAAWFDPAAIRRSSRRHLLHTDASHRFERGADFNAAPTANALVSQLILQNGGHAEGDLIDVVIPEIAARTASRPPIQLSVQQVQRHLGTTLAPEGITAEIVQQYLTALGCTLTPKTADTFQVQLPSWRLDLEREIDLVEEVARVYGYNRFANTLPTPGIVIAHPTAAKEAAVRARLLALGFSESISSTFASQQDANLFTEATNPGAPSSRPLLGAKVGIRASEPLSSSAPKNPGAIPLENPLSEEASLLRPSLIPGMVTMLSNNLNRDVKEVRLFEQGQIFTGTTETVSETPQLSLGLTTASPQTIPPHMAQDAPFFELKGAIESLLSLFMLSEPKESSPQLTGEAKESSSRPALNEAKESSSRPALNEGKESSSRPEAAHFAAEAERPASLPLSTEPKDTSSRPEQRTVSSSVAEWRDPCISSLSPLTFTPEAPQWLQPGRSATALLHGTAIAHFGELVQTQKDQRKLRQPIYLAQLDLAKLYELPLKKVIARDLSRFQAVERDFSFIFPDAVQWHTIATALNALAIGELQSVKPVEVWRDSKKYSGVYSLLVRCVFQSNDRTLRDDELTTWWSTIIATLTALGGTIRA